MIVKSPLEVVAFFIPPFVKAEIKSEEDPDKFVLFVDKVIPPEVFEFIVTNSERV